MKTLFKFCFCALLFTSCNAVYLEKPVPQSGKEITTIPLSWSGVFEMIEPGKENDTTLFKQCLRMERMSNSQLFISGEIRFAKKDLPALKELYKTAQKDGRLSEFMVTNRFIYSTMNPTEPDKSSKPERQITALAMEGDWFVLTNTIEPLLMLDLTTNTVTKFDKTNGNVQDSDLLPEADSLSSSIFPMVFRQKQQTYFLNIQTDNQAKWSLYAISETGKDRMTLKMFFLKDKTSFDKRSDYYNKITPFQSEGSDFLINPTDQALDQLLAEPELFESGYLKKIGEE